MGDEKSESYYKNLLNILANDEEIKLATESLNISTENTITVIDGKVNKKNLNKTFNKLQKVVINENNDIINDRTELLDQNNIVENNIDENNIVENNDDNINIEYVDKIAKKQRYTKTQLLQELSINDDILEEIVPDDYNPTIDDIIPDCGDVDNIHLSKIIPTTVTIKASLSNIKFTEEKLVKRLKPDNNIKSIVSNYGCFYHESYIKEEMTKKSNRGRKKIHKPLSNRKPQGNGNAFNSQTSLEIYHDGRLYPIKVFRNGNIQFPGSSRDRFYSMMFCINTIINKFNELLYNGRELIHLTKLIPVMKNYKYHIKMEENEIIYLQGLRDIILRDKLSSPLTIFNVKYGLDQAKVQIKFNTPMFDSSETFNSTKKLTIHIFKSGKVNVQGGLNEAHVLQSYEFIKSIIINNRDYLIYDPKTYEIKEDIVYKQLDRYWYINPEQLDIYESSLNLIAECV